MFRLQLYAAVSLTLTVGCTAANPAFDLETGADSGTPKGDSGSDTSEPATDSGSADSAADGHDTKSETGHDDGHDDDGHDDDGHDDDGHDDDGDNPRGCGVKDCDDDEYCAFPEGASCGIETDVRGTCMPRPDACIGIGEPVIGCNCQPFDSACLAQQAGFDTLCLALVDDCEC